MKVKDLPVGSWIYAGDVSNIQEQNRRYYSYRSLAFEKINEKNEFRSLSEFRVCFDFEESNAPHINLQTKGSNCYYDSDLRLWLNSYGTNWRKPKNEYEKESDFESARNRPYVMSKGFMSNFTECFVNALCTMEIDCDITEKDKIKLHGKSKKCYDLFTIEDYSVMANDYWGKIITKSPSNTGYIKLTNGKNMAACGAGYVKPICKMDENVDIDFEDFSNERTYYALPDKKLYFPIEKYGEIPDIEIFNIL